MPRAFNRAAIDQKPLEVSRTDPLSASELWPHTIRKIKQDTEKPRRLKKARYTGRSQ